MQEWLSKPGFLGTYATFGADLSYLMALLFTGLFLRGWYLAWTRRGANHHRITLWGMIAMIAYFSGYYWARSLGVLAVEGKEGFGGPDAVYDRVFTPVLTIHILVVTIGLIMAVYMIVLGFRVSEWLGEQRVLKAGELMMSWKGILTFLAIAFGLIAGLFLLRLTTREYSERLLVVYLVFFFLIVIVLMFEKVIERLWPDGARRHRLLGRFTMVLYLIALVTSTTTYVMLYVMYPPKVGIPYQGALLRLAGG